MITDSQLHILRHSLGLTYGKKIYRNHFVTGEGSKDYDDCCALVDAGLMVKHKGNELTGGDDLFTVTNAGIDLAKQEPSLENQ